MIRPRLILRVLGALMVMVAMAMLFPWAIALFEGKGEQLGFLIPIVVAIPLGLFLFFRKKLDRKDEISNREAFLIATLGWAMAALVAAIPFWIYGSWMHHLPGKSPFPTFAMAYFESMSGLTTTGSTILNDIEALPNSMLFWRYLSH